MTHLSKHMRKVCGRNRINMSMAINALARHLYEVWQDEVRISVPSMEPIHYDVLPESIRKGWEKVARECVMEAPALVDLKKFF